MPRDAIAVLGSGNMGSGIAQACAQAGFTVRVRDLIDAFGEEIESVSFGKPTLEDVFVHLTGHQFFAHTSPAE